jgi:sterol desaturase/sphingolipid hydroxylase (fatty acid hydroxylase superfamily)
MAQMKLLRSMGKLMGANATRAAIPAFLATIAIEYLSLRDRSPAEPGDDIDSSNVDEPVGYEPRDAAASVAMGLGSLFVNGFAGKALGRLDEVIYQRRLGQFGSRAGGFALAVVVWDFAYYWNHRLSHEHRVLWAAHVNHHSSQRYNLSTALRQSWTGFIVHWVYLPMYAMGFSTRQVARAGELNLLYQYWVHTETLNRLPGSLEQIMNTASHHRVHHGANEQYLDRNYAGILILWDRLFGTFEPEGERIQYGLTKNIDTFNPMKIAFHEWASLRSDVNGATNWLDRFGYLLGPPGWQPPS